MLGGLTLLSSPLDWCGLCLCSQCSERDRPWPLMPPFHHTTRSSQQQLGPAGRTAACSKRGPAYTSTNDVASQRGASTCRMPVAVGASFAWKASTFASERTAPGGERERDTATARSSGVSRTPVQLSSSWSRSSELLGFSPILGEAGGVGGRTDPWTTSLSGPGMLWW